MHISVIVPVFNVEDKISRCIDSILSQTLSDYELILVDDGSNDLSGIICDEYAKNDKRITVIHQENRGVSNARNVGIQHSKGTFISFVDSDDFIEPQYLEVMLDSIVKQQAELAIAGVSFCDAQVKTIQPQADCGDYVIAVNKSNTGRIAELIDEKRLNYVYSKLYLRKIIIKNNICFDESIQLGEDTLFVMDYLAHVNSISIIGKSFYFYVRYGDGTLSSKFFDNQYERYNTVNDYLEKRLRELELLDQTTQRSVDKRRIQSAVWTVEGLRLSRSISNDYRLSLIEKTINDRRFVEAAKRQPDIIQDTEEFIIMNQGNATRLLKYYKTIEQKIKIRRLLSSSILGKTYRKMKHCLLPESVKN